MRRSPFEFALRFHKRSSRFYRRQPRVNPARSGSPAAQSLAILIPVFNDWECAALLLPLLNQALASAAIRSQIVLIDDGSSVAAPPDLVRKPLSHIVNIQVVHLRRNLGHQRAIAIGLYYIHEHMAADAVIVMDGDGEDRPNDIPALLEEFQKCNRREIVFAARTRRLEKPAFRFFYHVYRLLHRVLTGAPVKVGNFSVIPRDCIGRLMVSSDLWNHYAAAVFRSRLPFRTVPLARGARLNGQSRMNFFALVVHGLSAISVFADVVSVRLLVGAASLVLLSLLLIAGVVGVRLATPLAIPGWANVSVGVLAVICLQAVMLATVLVLPIVSARSNTSFIPLRDSEFYILQRKQVWPKK